MATHSGSASITPKRTGVPYDAAAARKLALSSTDDAVLACSEDTYAPPVSQDELSWVAVNSANEVEMVDEATGEVYGSPIALPSGSDPVGIAYWTPPAGSAATSNDPIVVVLNGNDTVTFINTVTEEILSTLSLGGSGSDPLSIAVSTTSDFAAVTDTASSDTRVVILDVATRAVAHTFSDVASGTGDINQLIFDPSGDWIDAASVTNHKVYSFEMTSSSSPYFTQETTYSGAGTWDPYSLAADETTPTSDTMYVTAASHMYAMTTDPPSVISDFATWSSTPGHVAVEPGSANAYVTFPSTGKVGVVNLSTHSVTLVSATTTPGALAVNDTTGAVYVGDAASGATDMKIYTWQGSSLLLSATSTLDGIATAVATPNPAYIHYDVFAASGTAVTVTDSATGDVVQTITDDNDALDVVPSPDGREVYVVNAASDNGGSSTPSVQIITTPNLGTAGTAISSPYLIPQSQSTPYSYSLSNVPVPVSAALSPSGDTLLVTDSANSVVFSFEVGPSSSDTELGKVIGVAHLDGSTSVTPEAVTVTPDGSAAFVADAAGITDLTYSGSTGAYGSPDYQAGSSLHDSDSHELETPVQIVASNDGRSVYVLDATSGRPLLFQFPLTTSDTLGDETETAIPAGTDPVGLSLSPEDAVAYVSDVATDEVYALDISDGSGTEQWGTAAYVVPGLSVTTPDGQYVAVTDETKTEGCDTDGVDGFSILEADNGTDDIDVDLGDGNVVTSLAVSPVSSSVQDVTTTSFQGQLSWPEMIGGSNPDESAVGGLEDVQSGGTPTDAPGVSAGTNTDLRSYELSLDAMSLPSVGPSLDVSASYDSALIANGVDTGSTPAPFAQGWRLSTEVTATQRSHSASIDPCQIDVTQATGAEVYFEPVAEAPYSSCPTSDYEAPPWAQAKLSNASDCTGTDSCWVVTNEISGLATYIDSTSSAHQLVKEVDRNGNTLSFSYTSGVLTSMTGSDRTIDFSYPSAGTSPCPSSFNSQTVAKCLVATDPIGRTATFVLANAPTAGYDLIGETLAESGDTSASYAFDYSSNLMTSWWDPQNFATYGTTAEATDVSYAGDSLDWVTQVTAPQVTDQGTDMTDTYTPTYTFTYPCQDLFVGSGTVIMTDANANWNAANPDDAVPGANITLDDYVDFGLAAQVQGYGPAENDNADAVTSETATTLRDPLTLLPDETINPLADTGSGTLFNAGTTFYTYDALGNVLATTTPGPTDGTWATTTSQYNVDNEPLSGTDADGNPTTYTYNSGGEVLTTTSPSTNEWTSAPETSDYYNSNGTICASRTADEVASYGVLTSCSTSHDTYYTYDSEGDELTSVDPLGDVSTTAYDGDGDVCATLTPDGYAASDRLTSCPSEAEPYETVNLTRDVYNDVTSSASPSNAPGGTTWSYYNLNDDEIASVSVLGSPGSCNPLTTTTCLYTSYEIYDPDGSEISSTTPTATSGDSGPTTTTFFDPDGNSVATVSPAGNDSDSPASYEQVTVNDSIGDDVADTPVASLSADCSVTSTSSLCPNTSFSTYDANGDATASYTPNSSGEGTTSSSTAYDPAGDDESDVSSTGSGSTSTTTNSYDLNGNQLTSTDVGHSGSGSVTTGTTTTYEPDGSTCWSSTLAWTGESAPTCAAPPLSSGNETTMDYYDGSGNLVATTAPGGNPYASDNTSGCDPLTTAECADTTYYAFNEAGQQVTATLPEDANDDYGLTTTYYDADGNAIAVQGPAGSPGTCDPVTTSTCTDTIYKTYDADDRVDTVDYTDGTPDVTYTYNDDGTTATMGDGTGTTSYSYSPIGQVVSSTNGAGATDTWAFNQAGQMICESYPNSSSDTCSSSGAGTTSPPNGDLSFFYDAQGRLSLEATWTGVTLSYGYDCAGDVAWVSTGTTSTTECDTSSDSDPSAPTGSAVTTSYGYDSSSGLQSSQATTASGGSINLLSFAFGYDQQGRLTSSTPTVGSTELATDSYGYDSDDRVDSGPIVGGSGSTSYGYTTAGGITADTNTFATAGYSASGELCWTSTTTGSSACSATPSPRTAYSYNDDGERTAVTPPSGGDPESLGWDISSQELTCINTDGTTCSTSDPTATTTLYTYNGDNLRMSAQNGDTTTSFTWSATGDQLLADSAHDYIYGSDQATPIMQIETADYESTPSVDLIVGDTNDNARGVVQLQGDTSADDDTLVNYTDYDAYGEPITASGGTSNPGGLAGTSGVTYQSLNWGFGASYSDTSGLDYLVNRYYDPQCAQFVSVDPDVSTTLQPYSYASDDPTSLGDPTGLAPFAHEANMFIKVKKDIHTYIDQFDNGAKGNTNPGVAVGEATQLASKMLSLVTPVWEISTISKSQMAQAYIIFAAALLRSISRNHALQMVAAAFRESSLHFNAPAPHVKGCPKGSGGLFQLCSSTLRRVAKEYGGVDNPIANTWAILTPYSNYWKENPHAVKGEAAVKVEVSGASAKWYAGPMPWFQPFFPWEFPSN